MVEKGERVLTEGESLGKYLKEKREAKNYSLKEVAKNTRVREHILSAIEEDRNDLLPASTYLKGFLSAYAKYLGLDPQEVILRYEMTLKKEPSAPAQEVLPSPNISSPKIPTFPRIHWNKRVLYWVGGIFVVLLIIASFFLFRNPSHQAVPTVSENPKVESNTPSSTEVPPQESASSFSTKETKPFLLEMRAVEKTWVSLRVDGQPEKEIMFHPGEGATYQAMEQIRMVIGNAGGFDLTLNGKPLERFGKSGEVITLIFTPRGVETRRAEPSSDIKKE
jgi:cytoskeletal protein RodZ